MTKGIHITLFTIDLKTIYYILKNTQIDYDMRLFFIHQLFFKFLTCNKSLMYSLL